LIDCSLPPFPTRRSSDLFSERLDAGLRRGESSLRGAQTRGRQPTVYLRLVPFMDRPLYKIRHDIAVPANLPFLASRLSIGAYWIDRKSTRLNSSHLGISY